MRKITDRGARDCGKKVCHACGLMCHICGAYFCGDHDTPDFAALGLCENCVGVYAEIPDGPERTKLIEIENRLQARNYYHAYGMQGDFAKLLEIAKDALQRKTKDEDSMRELSNAAIKVARACLNLESYHAAKSVGANTPPTVSAADLREALDESLVGLCELVSL